MAEAIAKNRAKKILLPLTPVQVKVVGMEEEAETKPLNHLVARLVARLEEIAEREAGN
ncbi:MAG: DUF3842 family protein [Firmicutes bacterium]|nr:DUF3842 family protein [Bacillota bacterium]